MPGESPAPLDLASDVVAFHDGPLPISRRLLPIEQPLKEFFIRSEVRSPQAIHGDSEIDEAVVERIRENAESAEDSQMPAKRFLATVPIVDQERVRF